MSSFGFQQEIDKAKLLSQLDAKWNKWIPGLFEKPYWDDIVVGINKSIANKRIVVPKLDNIFKALNNFQPDNFKVLLIGQDPYPTLGNATGESFAVTKGKTIPKSLLNVYKEIDRCFGSNMCTLNEKNGDLSSWSRQGVLLLNAILTIGVSMQRGIQPESHEKIGWREFVQDIIRWLDNNYKFVTLALGNSARITSELLIKNTENVIVTGHPSPMNTTRKFYGCNCFNECLPRQS